MIALMRWQQRGGRARAWLAATFGVLAFVVIAGRLTPKTSTTAPVEWARKIEVAILVLVPYFLYRFALTFEHPPAWVTRVGGALTVATAGGILFFAHVPHQGQPRSPAFQAYVVLLLVQWTFLSVTVSLRLWRGGRGQASITRKRMRTLSLGSSAMAVALLLGGATPSSGPNAFRVVAALIGLASGPLFLLGFAPPQFVLATWRCTEDVDFRRAESGLMRAMTPVDVADVLLPHVVRMVGGGSAVLANVDQQLIGYHGVTEREAEAMLRSERSLDAAERERLAVDGATIILPLQSGQLTVRANVYTPYFGREELEVLRGLGGLTDLALTRVNLAQRERQIVEELRAANETMRDFVAIASHDLRTPLAIIKGLSAFMSSGGSTISEPDRQKYLSSIERQAGHLTELVEDLLTVSRIDAGVVETHRSAVAIDEIIKQSAQDSGQLDNIRLALAPRLIADADADHVRRILTNYITNAFRYGKPPVEIETSDAGESIIVRVRDHGDGVPEEFHSRMFEKFARVENRKSGNTDGTGLGLSIVRGLARAGGGDAWYESGAAAACFAVSFPKADPGDALTKPIVVVVEDEADVRLLVKVTLSRDPRLEMGGEASNAEDALELARTTSPSLFILDHSIEGDMMGLQVAPLLKKASPEAKILFFTAFDMASEARDEPAIDGYLRKTDFSKLLPTADALLGLSPL